MWLSVAYLALTAIVVLQLLLQQAREQVVKLLTTEWLVVDTSASGGKLHVRITVFVNNRHCIQANADGASYRGYVKFTCPSLSCACIHSWSPQGSRYQSKCNSVPSIVPRSRGELQEPQARPLAREHRRRLAVQAD